MRAAASALRHTRYADPAGRTIRAGLHIGHPWRASAAISYRPLWGPLQRCTYLQQLFRTLRTHTVRHTIARVPKAVLVSRAQQEAHLQQRTDGLIPFLRKFKISQMNKLRYHKKRFLA